MPIDFLDFLFEGVIFVLIVHQSHYFLSTYLLPMVKDDYDIASKEKERLHHAIEKTRKSISSKETLLIQQTEHLSILETMVIRWQEKTIKNQEKKNKEQAHFFDLFNEKLKTQLTKHAQNKNQIHALKTCSRNALEQSQKENPQLYKLYTQKALSLFLSKSKEK